MASGRHSYVAFYPSDWLAGTARMTRLHRSIYFDICVYIWDHNAPCPASEQRLMLGDLSNWQELVQDLIDSGKLVTAEDGSLSNPRAKAEAEKSFALWERKSAGGKAAVEKINSRKTPDGSADRSAVRSAGKSPAIEPEPEPEPEPEIIPDGITSSSPPSSTVVSIMEAKDGVDAVFDGWNNMARFTGGILPVAVKLTEKRREQIKARLREFDSQTIIAAINSIRSSPFLMGDNDKGWRADFDFVLQPSSLLKLIEGKYHGTTGKLSGWRER
jgi:hypothetical protein